MNHISLVQIGNMSTYFTFNFYLIFTELKNYKTSVAIATMHMAMPLSRMLPPHAPSKGKIYAMLWQ